MGFSLICILYTALSLPYLFQVEISHAVPIVPFSNNTFTDIKASKGRSEIDSESVNINSTWNAGGPSAILNFLKRFGYLQETNNSDTLYSEHTVVDAIRVMQRFAALPETGVLDSETQSLLTKPRCGMPDIEKSKPNGFTLGSKGWNKRRLSYSIENWSSKLTEKEVSEDIRKALNVWAGHSHLKFESKSKHSENVDIAISFGRGYHGDSYPFDGSGNILAHAFYPQNSGGKGNAGDVHFDEDENWYSSSSSSRKEGISFLATAVHELGHSLGLSHSHTPTSVMFPYYQAPQNEEPKLDYDDIMALYHLYIMRNIDDREVETTPKTFPHTTRRTIGTTTSSTTTRFPVSTDLTPTTSEHPTHYTTPHYESEDSEPSLCSIGQFDEIQMIRNEIFVFKGEYMWRFFDKGRPTPGHYPAKISQLFSIAKNFKRVDAAFERESDGKIIFISGKFYWTTDGTAEGNSGPHPLTDFGLPKSLEQIDAAFVWGKNQKLYFFRDNLYWKYNETIGTIENGYPKDISRWRGVPDHLGSVINKDGKTYFFKNNEYWKFDNYMVKTEDDYPMNTLKDWFNC